MTQPSHSPTFPASSFASPDVVSGLLREIERLRDELAETRMGHRVIVAAMSEEREQLTRAITQLNASVQRATADLRIAERERNEARRGCCNVDSDYRRMMGLPRAAVLLARDKGWDCFEDAAVDLEEDAQ
jgi:HAMP domain-containing protein